MIDIHSHILFGLDDGAQTLEDSIALIKMAYVNGTTSMIATTHFRQNRYSYTNEELEQVFFILTKKIEEVGIPIKIYLGHEAYLDEHLLEELLNNRCKTLNGSRYVLIEIGKEAPSQMIYKMLYDILLKGYIPIIAHCERLIRTMTDCKSLMEMKRMGCLLQVNASALFWGKGVPASLPETKLSFFTRITRTKDAFLKLNKYRVHNWLIKRLKDRTISFVSSDSHNVITRTPLLLPAYKKIVLLAGNTIAEEVFILNAEKVIKDELIR